MASLVKKLLGAMLFTVAPLALGADWKPLQGTIAITAENYLDPSSTEPKDSHVRFQLSGRTAKDVYAAMRVAPKADDCTGAMVKQIGEMKCLQFQDKRRHECSFSIDVMRQTIGYGVAC